MLRPGGMEEFVTEDEEPWYDQRDLEQGREIPLRSAVLMGVGCYYGEELEQNLRSLTLRGLDLLTWWGQWSRASSNWEETASYKSTFRLMNNVYIIT